MSIFDWDGQPPLKEIPWNRTWSHDMVGGIVLENVTPYQEKPREPFRGWHKRRWVPSWLWNLVASITTQDALLLALEKAEAEIIRQMNRRLYGAQE